MTTEDDVFWLYERNSHEYSICEGIKAGEPCQSEHREYDNINYGKECFCHLDSVVYSINIGYRWTPCRMKTKSYIRIGEECPICIEPILYKSNANLTSCGHSFHRKCIQRMIGLNRLRNIWDFICPLCRTNTGEYDDLFRYNSRTRNGLDRLEEFWMNKEHKSCRVCDFSSLHNHYLGFNKNCKECLSYREFGR